MLATVYLMMTPVHCFLAILISVLICVKSDGDRYKIPNREVMNNWAQWIVKNVGHDLGTYKDIADECVKGPVNKFQQRWPDFMQHYLSPKSVAKERGAKSSKTPERIYQVYLFALMLCLGERGWEVTIEEPAGLRGCPACLEEDEVCCSDRTQV